MQQTIPQFVRTVDCVHELDRPDADIDEAPVLRSDSNSASSANRKKFGPAGTVSGAATPSSFTASSSTPTSLACAGSFQAVSASRPLAGQHPPELRHRLLGPTEVRQTQVADDHVEAPVREGERLRVALIGTRLVGTVAARA